MDLVSSKVAKMRMEKAVVVAQSRDDREAELRAKLQNAQCRFNLVSDENELEAIIYEMKSLEATLTSLLKSSE